MFTLKCRWWDFPTILLHGHRFQSINEIQLIAFISLIIPTPIKVNFIIKKTKESVTARNHFPADLFNKLHRVLQLNSWVCQLKHNVQTSQGATQTLVQMTKGRRLLIHTAVNRRRERLTLKWITFSAARKMFPKNVWETCAKDISG